MNPQQLLTHFDRMCEAPDAVTRVRQLILDLAVRGKLIEQDPNDEPATELLKRIEAQLLKNGQVKKWGLLAAVRPEDIRFNVPENWCWAKLGTISQVLMGQSPPGNTYNKDGVGVPLINGPVEFTHGPFGTTVINQYTTDPTNVCEEGDLLVCVRGSTTGRTNIAGFRACIGRGVAAVRPFFGARYIHLVIWRLRASIIAMGRGIAFPSISKQQIEELPVPVPPLAELHRIVAKVDELMALCDQLEAAQAERETRRNRLNVASLQRLNQPFDAPKIREHAEFYLNCLPKLTTSHKHVQQFQQALIDLAVHGHLVPRDPSDEPAFELLSRIQKEKGKLSKENSAKKQRDVPSLPNDNVPFEVPESWRWVRLGETGFTQTGTTPSSSNPEYFGNYIPFVKPADLTGKTTNYTGEGISKEGLKYSRLISKGSVLMVCIGSSIGKVNIIERDVCCNQQINTVTPFVESMTPFLSMILKSTYFQKLVRDSAGMGTLPIISKGKWELLPVPVPPIAEQERIVAKVEEITTICEMLQTELVNTQSYSRRLLDAVLHEAIAPAG